MNFPRHNLYVFLEILGLCLVLISGCVLGWAMFGEKNYVLIGISGLVFTIFLLITLTLMLDPDKIRARQSLSVLGLLPTCSKECKGASIPPAHNMLARYCIVPLQLRLWRSRIPRISLVIAGRGKIACPMESVRSARKQPANRSKTAKRACSIRLKK